MTHSHFYLITDSPFFLRSELYPAESGKLTGMLLEMDKSLLVHLINNPKELESKATEAVEALREHTAKENQ
jgi:hypothetical protein